MYSQLLFPRLHLKVYSFADTWLNPVSFANEKKIKLKKKILAISMRCRYGHNSVFVISYCPWHFVLHIIHFLWQTVRNETTDKGIPKLSGSHVFHKIVHSCFTAEKKDVLWMEYCAGIQKHIKPWKTNLMFIFKILETT